MRLRPARPDEIEALQAVDKSARGRYAALAGFDYVVSAPPIGVDRFGAGETVVAEQDGDVVGFALAQPLDGMLCLANISVVPPAGRQGLGSALVEHLFGRARNLNAGAVTLATFKLPPWNGPWFRRRGFVAMPEQHIGSGLRAVLTRHATFLDMATRETLWRACENR